MNLINNLMHKVYKVMGSHKTMKKNECPHIREIKILKSSKAKCQKCNVTENLRICTSCGSVHCCESSNAHNTEHFKKTNHAIIKPIHCDYDFTWCYKCNAYLE